MKDESKTRKQLINELAELRKLVTKLRRSLTYKSKLRKALEISEAKYKELVQNANSIIIILDKNANIKFFNKFAQEFFGYNESEILGRNVLGTVLPERDSSGCDLRPIINTLISNPERFVNFESENTRKNGEPVWVAWTNKAVFDDEGNIAEIYGIGTDITRRRIAEQQIQYLTQQLMKAQEEERHTLSAELHDRVGQDLYKVQIELETLFHRRQNSPTQIRKRVAGLAKIVQAVIADVREIAHDLTPAGFDQVGLVDTIFHYCKDFFAKNDVSVDFYSAGINNVRLGFDTEINLYRLVQEALSNIKKHAKAKRVVIRLVASFPNVVLRIEDDGVGFDVRQRLAMAFTEKRLGFRIMKERVRLLGGTLKIHSRPMNGTMLFIEVPYRERKNGSKEEDHNH